MSSSGFETAPAILYKYRRFDPQGKHVRLLRHGEVWFPSARDFNDPFDTAFRYNFDGLHDELGERWIRIAVKRQEPHLNHEQSELRAKTRLAELRNDPEEIQKMHQFSIETNYRAWGICSLCTVRDNLLLWAHYSQDHKGFCVGLSTNALDSVSRALVRDKLTLDLQKVNYSPVLPNPNFFEKMINLEDTSYIRDFIGTKSPDWSYEQEYRLVFYERANFSLRIPLEAVAEVILGCRITTGDKELLIRTCRTHLPHARLFQARKEETRFALVLEPIN